MAELLLFPIAPTAADGRPPDWEERERALDTRASFIVEAPAGSGKTGLLIQRYLKLLGDAGTEEPEQVLAITFTRKATGELRERIRGQLEAALAGTAARNPFEQETRVLAEAVLRRDRERGWGLLGQPRRLKIRTIDAICSEIARALPLLSGGGRQTPTPESQPLYRAAARRTLMQLGGEDRALDAALRTLLMHRDGNLGDCERQIADMLGTRDQWGGLIPLTCEHLEDAYLDETVLPRFERALDLAICRALTQLTRTLPEDLLRELTMAAAELGHLSGYNGGASPIAFCAGRHEPPGEFAAHLEHWRALVHLVVTPSSKTWRKGFAKNHMQFEPEKKHTALLKDLVARLQHRDDVLAAMGQLNKLPPARYPMEQWVVAKALFRALGRALVELQMVFAETGQCDFAELGLSARSALGNDAAPDVLTSALGFETRHLLVDEMQDTSTSQYDLLERLTRGWDGRSQTVFLVGDPKQSIYRFRQARVERFVQTMHKGLFGDLPLEALRLTANFRSQQHLVEQFNHDFSQLFPRAVNLAHPEEVPYVQAAAVRGTGTSAGLVWHTQVVDPGPDGHNRLLAERSVAREIRNVAIEWMGRSLPEKRTTPWRVAVLVRSRNVLGSILAALKQEGDEGAVPFRSVEIEELGERQEILDLLGLTRALLHPGDRVAWLAVLHAPWCGLGLGDLHALTGLDDPGLRERCIPDLIHERGHLISEDGEARLGRIWPVLEAASGSRGALALATRVERTWRSLGGDASLSTEAQANAARFFTLLEEMEGVAGRIDLSTLEVRLKKLYAEPSVHPGAIDIMTIHGAKGLEWDVVLVPALERRGQMDSTHLLEWAELDSEDAEAAPFILAPIPGKGEESKDLNRWIRDIHATREAAERKRLLYVAYTRASEELHLFASPVLSAKGEIKPAANSLLKTAWPIAEPHFADVEAAVGSGLALAAGAEDDPTSAHPPLLQRLPLSFDPSERFHVDRPLPTGVAAPEGPTFARPEGSFAARSFGNAVHAMLDLIASQPKQPLQPSQAIPIISALLRADGLAPAVVERLAQRVADALTLTLADPDGRWLLGHDPDAPIHEAASEVALAGGSESFTSIRLDRMFYAGFTPRTAADPTSRCLWIVDYKTAAHGDAGLEEFLDEEREKYMPQLETYARAMAQMHAPAEIRVALYYPALARLIWWISEAGR